MISMIVFDMAGTTVDEDNVVYKTLQRSIHDAGYEVGLTQVLALGAGKAKRTAIVDILASLDDSRDIEKEADRIYEDFLTDLADAYANLDVKGQPGAETLFSWLQARGIKVVLNTGYDRQTAESLLDKLSWVVGDQIDYLITADQVERGRPHPDMITKAMRQFAIDDPREVIKIGDSIIDIEEGKSAGCVTIGATTGAHTRAQLQTANPDHIIDALSEVPELLSN